MLAFSDVMAAFHLLKPCRLVLIVAIVATPVAAFAQGAAPPTDLHRYPLPTYEEDWRALQGVDRTDVWDPVKFVPLSADGTISLSRASPPSDSEIVPSAESGTNSLSLGG